MGCECLVCKEETLIVSDHLKAFCKAAIDLNKWEKGERSGKNINKTLTIHLAPEKHKLLPLPKIEHLPSPFVEYKDVFHDAVIQTCEILIREIKNCSNPNEKNKEIER